MKKILAFSILVVVCSGGIFAQSTQSANELKNFRFGVAAMPDISWYTPNDLKKFASNGSVFKFGVVINGEYNFSKNVSMGFGLGIASAGGKVAFTDSVRYFYSNDAIIKQSDTTGLKGKYTQYKLNSRKYSASYFVIPISLKMRTNQIGYMRYFFQPSLNIGIRKKVLATDDLTTLPPNWPKTVATSANSGQSANQTNLDITKDMALIRLSASISAGAEYYISGSTALIFSVGYDYGLTGVAKSTSDYLVHTASGSPSNGAVTQKFIQSGVVLSVGVLF